MQAIVQKEYGSAEVLSMADIPRPTVAARAVLVEVRAAGLDRGTWHLMAGMPYVMRIAGFGLRAPKTRVPGLDLAGVVAAVGAEVTRFKPGDAVFGIGKGTYAEFAAAHEDKLALKPPGLSFEEAAALAISGLTALRGICDVGRVEAGQHVLIIGASGGVGTYAVQVAKAMGATVTGVCSAAKADLVRSLGADHVVDYATEDFADGRARYDVILDMAGNASLSRLRGALAPDGTLVVAGGEDGGRWIGGTDRQLRALALSPFVRQRMTTFIAKEHFSGLERLADLVGRGELRPVLDRTYPLEQTADAMRQLVAGGVRGKVVVTP